MWKTEVQEVEVQATAPSRGEYRRQLHASRAEWGNQVTPGTKHFNTLRDAEKWQICKLCDFFCDCDLALLKVRGTVRRGQLCLCKI